MRPPRRIGHSTVSVAPFGLGTAPLGGWPRALDPGDCRATVRAAWDCGVRHFDTAPYYGFGDSEEHLGAVLAGMPRAEFTVSTKVGRLLLDGADADPFYKGAAARRAVFDFSYDAVAESLAGSRRRLGLDHLDMALVHDPDEHHAEALEGAFRALRDLRAEGEVAAIGFAMNASGPLSEFARETDPDCLLVAGRYSLLDPSALADLLPVAAEQGASVIVGGVYNSGVLADPYATTTFDYAPADAELVHRARRLDAVCRDHGVPLRAAAMQFPSFHPAVATVIVGALTPDEARENAALFDHDIPGSLWDDLRSAGLVPPEAPTPSAAGGVTDSPPDRRAH